MSVIRRKRALYAEPAERRVRSASRRREVRNAAEVEICWRWLGTAWLSCCRVPCHGTYRSLITVRSAGHVVGDEGAPLPHRPRRACGGVLGRLQLELGVNFGAEQNDVERDVKPEQ